MFKINKKSDKLIIVVHEIYGINQHMVDLCELLAEQNFDVICPNLLEQEIPIDYPQEEKAYRNFVFIWFWKRNDGSHGWCNKACCKKISFKKIGKRLYHYLIIY